MFQVHTIRKNLEGLLIGEGDIVFSHISREIDINLEYLSLLETSPDIITPNFLNVMRSDEAIVENLYTLMSGVENQDLDKVPLTRFAVLDMKGNVIFSKGGFTVSPAELKPFIENPRETIVTIPTGRSGSLHMGMRVKERVFFFKIDEGELEALRKKLIIQDITDREEKRFNIVGINVYDEKGKPFSVPSGSKADALVLSRPLESKFLPGYSVEILVSRALARDTLRRTIFSFVLILGILLLSGVVSTYIIFFIRKKHDERLRELEKEMTTKERLVSLGRLASGMAHEIRNPLNAMGLSVQRLKREFLPDEDKREEYLTFLDIIRGELGRVNRIVEDFLLSTRAQAPFMKEDLWSIIDEVVVILGERAGSKNVSIENKTDRGVVISCQKDRLKQAVYNIVLNGIEAIEEHGAITVWTRVKEETVEIHVEDSGPGIREDELHRVFEYYYTTKDKGMGLGLPISYMIVKDHGGDIKVSSTEGEGVHFTIYLPLGHTQTDEGRKR